MMGAEHSRSAGLSKFRTSQSGIITQRSPGGWCLSMSPTSSSVSITQAGQNEQKTNVRIAQIRLLYENANTGFIVTVITAPILAYFLSSVIEHRMTIAWLLYMLLITSA